MAFLRGQDRGIGRAHHARGAHGPAVAPAHRGIRGAEMVTCPSRQNTSHRIQPRRMACPLRGQRHIETRQQFSRQVQPPDPRVLRHVTQDIGNLQRPAKVLGHLVRLGRGIAEHTHR